MKQRVLKTIFSIVLILMLFIPNKTQSATYTRDYTIEAYDINVVVNEDNTLDITETITAYFNVDKHGIYRKIPLRNTVSRLDGTTSKNRVKITNVSVNEEYSSYNKDGYKVIKIGSKNSTFRGKHNYTIKYTYDIGKDPLKDVDELYFNLIGNEWDTTINGITFTIQMPKSFDESLLGFSSGVKGSANSSNIYYDVDGNTITGNVYRTLNVGEALTIRLTLPEGYFVKNTKLGTYQIVSIILSITAVVIAIIIYKKAGKKENVVETVEFYPPEGYNSAEVGFLYNGSADNKAIISLLVYLADKGYLKIEQIEEKGIFSKTKSFKITKLKEYDGNNENERIFFNGLFSCPKEIDMEKVNEIKEEANKNGEKISTSKAMQLVRGMKDEKTVTASELKNEFYVTLDKIRNKMNSKENKNKIFEHSTKVIRNWIIFMIVIIVALMIIKPAIESASLEEAFLISTLSIIGFTILGLSNEKPTVFSKVIQIIVSMLFILVPCGIIMLPEILYDTPYLITEIIGIVSASILISLSKKVVKRTEFGNEMLGKIGGFKRFLETAEKPQLEALVEENPEYFYDILPYTYALGVSEKWMKQFETIAIQPPSWYECNGAFVMTDFNSFMNTTMQSAQSVMSSSPSSSSGGGSSGGGFSGGGSGGGGGGSW